jgi:hypothetical protein
MNIHEETPRQVGRICGLAIALALVGPIWAQKSSGRMIDTEVALKDQQVRDAQIRNLEINREGAADKALPKPAPQVVEQVKQDFGRIQEINAQIMKSYSSGEAPDYKHLSEVMAEMNKCASRLNTNLSLPEQAAYESLRQGGRSPLLDLNELVTRFVTNPIFKNANTIDAERAAHAKRDLADIIDLSRRIRKSADKLSKQGPK